MAPDPALEKLEEEALEGTYESEEISDEDVERTEAALGSYSSRLAKDADDAIDEAIENFEVSKEIRLPTVIEIQGSEPEEEVHGLTNDFIEEPPSSVELGEKKKFTIKIGDRTI